MLGIIQITTVNLQGKEEIINKTKKILIVLVYQKNLISKFHTILMTTK